MIPRTSIDEANRHLQQLHKRLHELEVTVHTQHEALAAKDKFLQKRVTEISTAKDKEIEGLSKKLLASERTVSVLQEELERKNQQIFALQHSHSKIRRLLNFKDDLSDLLRTMEDAEDNLILDEGDTDGLLSCYQRTKDAAASGMYTGSVSGKKSRKKRSARTENLMTATTLENGTHSDIEVATNLGGKEFYL
ncbi:uncharacterized protein LOC118479025 [Aplysia californica]|uniref:Uncharacterized protein LOC118479025 n=1 Tax=Aplysia californica TaxID=6500 RepID=A0ABM1W479_APLCA|nr:uncharacterized protein LOC118479025 [Aplysia californica]